MSSLSLEARGALPFIPFVDKAKRLVIRERFYMNTAPLSPVDCADPEISRLRLELFGASMSHGGDFKRLIDPIDRLLFNLIRDTECCRYQRTCSGPRISVG